MSVNSSSLSNTSFLPPEDIFYVTLHCLLSTAGSSNFIGFSTFNLVFLLPLCTLVLLLGVQRWRMRHPVSHTDLITFYVVAMELISVIASIFISIGFLADHFPMLFRSIFVYFINTTGQTAFHVLTCLERYMAVVHPVTYRRLTVTLGSALRKLVVSCVCLVSLAGSVVAYMLDSMTTIIFYVWVAMVSLAIISFCSVSVLHALLRPGPGDGAEAGGRRRPVDQAKLRAFYTIMAVLVAMMLRFGSDVVVSFVLLSPQLTASYACALWLATYWMSVPSNLVLPAIFLVRAGVLHRCNRRVGQGSD